MKVCFRQPNDTCLYYVMVLCSIHVCIWFIVAITLCSKARLRQQLPMLRLQVSMNLVQILTLCYLDVTRT
jgi:hypothetical protein